MSKLRKHLQTLRDEYRSQHYPGDLADDVLGSQATHNGRSTGGWMRLAVAAAAAVMLGAVVWVALDRPEPTQVVEQPALRTTPEVTRVAIDPTDNAADDLADDTAGIALPSLASAKPEASPVDAIERPTWSSVHEEEGDTRPSFSSIGGLSMPYQSIVLPSRSEIERQQSAAG